MSKYTCGITEMQTLSYEEFLTFIKEEEIDHIRMRSQGSRVYFRMDIEEVKHTVEFCKLDVTFDLMINPQDEIEFLAIQEVNSKIVMGG